MWTVTLEVNGCGGIDICCEVVLEDEREFACTADVFEVEGIRILPI